MEATTFIIIQLSALLVLQLCISIELSKANKDYIESLWKYIETLEKLKKEYESINLIYQETILSYQQDIILLKKEIEELKQKEGKQIWKQHQTCQI